MRVMSKLEKFPAARSQGNWDQGLVSRSVDTDTLDRCSPMLSKALSVYHWSNGAHRKLLEIYLALYYERERRKEGGKRLNACMLASVLR